MLVTAPWSRACMQTPSKLSPLDALCSATLSLSLSPKSRMVGMTMSISDLSTLGGVSELMVLCLLE